MWVGYVVFECDCLAGLHEGFRLGAGRLAHVVCGYHISYVKHRLRECKLQAGASSAQARSCSHRRGCSKHTEYTRNALGQHLNTLHTPDAQAEFAVVLGGPTHTRKHNTHDIPLSTHKTHRDSVYLMRRLSSPFFGRAPATASAKLVLCLTTCAVC